MALLKKMTESDIVTTQLSRIELKPDKFLCHTYVGLHIIMFYTNNGGWCLPGKHSEQKKKNMHLITFN